MTTNETHTPESLAALILMAPAVAVPALRLLALATTPALEQQLAAMAETEKRLQTYVDALDATYVYGAPGMPPGSPAVLDNLEQARTALCMAQHERGKRCNGMAGLFTALESRLKRDCAGGGL